MLLLLAVILLGAGAVRGDLAEDAEKYLLPWNLRPEHYDLTLFTNIENFRAGQEDTFVFSGISEITLGVLYGDVAEAVVHTYDNVNVSLATVVSLEQGQPQAYTVKVGSYDSETNKQIFQISPPLSNGGRYRLTIYYSGRNTDTLKGFYRSSFNGTDGATRWLLTTHFESFGAREAFPCLDEPEYKATYKLTVHYNETLSQQGYKAHFNTEIESEEIKNGVHITTFKTTPRPLSSYLVAFILAPFAISPEPAYFNSSFNGENGRKPVWTIGQPKYFSPRQDQLSQIAAPAALNAMTKFTNVGFGMDKVEQAGIPDFSAGAMENWGLVTYRETALFYNNETSTTQQKQSIMSTTTHELAHQWFGDLVTMHWWTDIWLNEGFATYFATHASDTFREPGLDTSTWDLIGQFVSGSLQKNAFVADARPTSRPLTAEAYKPGTIDGYFDSISYDKGGSVLRMWMHALGSDIFYRGLERYLRLQEESVGTPEILLASFDGAYDSTPESQRPLLPDLVATLFRGWHSQAGYPVVTVARNGDVLTLSQERFLSSAGNSSSRWNVPITYSTDVSPNFNNTSPVGYLLQSQASTTISLSGSPNWVVVNNQETGYYRVNYDQANWDKLLAIVSNPSTADQIHPYNRAQILDDAANLGASTHRNYLSLDVAMDFLSTLRHERHLVVWMSGLTFIDNLQGMLSENVEAASLLENYLRWLVEPAFTDLTLYVSESDSHTEKLLRREVAKLACQVGLETCRQQAGELYRTNNMHPDVRGVVMCEAVRAGDKETWSQILEIGLSSDETERLDYLEALTCTQQTDLINDLLTMVSTEGMLTEIDASAILLALSANKGTAYSRKALDAIDSRKWKLRGSYLDQLVNKISRHMTVYERASRPTIDKDLQNIIEGNSAWMTKKQPQILTWLINDRISRSLSSFSV